jgi:hypothetical protein
MKKGLARRGFAIHACGLVLVAICASAATTDAQKPALSDVLESAAGYLVEYSRQLSPVVAAEEEYMQRDPTKTMAIRRLHSDVVLVGLDRGNIDWFRDVFDIDGRAVRQREPRLPKLFQAGPLSNAVLQQAAAFEKEGVPYYLSANLRALDDPVLPLRLLVRDNQEKSRFTLDSVKTMDGRQVAILKFNTQDATSVLPTVPKGAKASGRLWVDVGTGAVKETELVITGKSFTLSVAAKYGLDPGIGLWVPVDVTHMMDIRDAGSGSFSDMGAGLDGLGFRQSLEGRAKYSKFRLLSPPGL